LEDCFTCLRRTDNFLCITERDEVSGENVEAVFAKHFWFDEAEYRNKTVCTSCWEKIDEFHKFYCELEVKQEVEEEDKKFPVVEDGEEASSDGEDHQEENTEHVETVLGVLGEESYESDSDVPLASRLAARKKKRAKRRRVIPKSKLRKEKADNEEMNDFIRQQMDITCHKSTTRTGTSRNLENHTINHHQFGESSNQEPGEPSHDLDDPAKSARLKRTAEDLAKEDDLIKQYVALNCSKCDFVGETFNKLSYHALKVHNMNTHSVICCDKKFGKRQRLYEHCLRHLNPDHFKCDICGKTYADSSGLQIHKWWIHTPISERPFKCDICGAAFVKDYLLKQHTKWHVNKERKTHFCEICNRAYSNSVQLKAHQQKKHGASCDWVCDICAKGFAHRALLEEHRLTHTEEGLASLKMQCEKCERWLINKKSYLRHRRRCLDTSGPVTCDICGKESVNEAALMGHKNFHHSKRPLFRCTYCGKECKTQLRLKEHEATHTGVILYQCPHCPRTSNSSSNMYTHKKTAHPDKWAEEVSQRFYTR
ncbi:AAEL002531-PA, partial [Aedes aegypti]